MSEQHITSNNSADFNLSVSIDSLNNTCSAKSPHHHFIEVEMTLIDPKLFEGETGSVVPGTFVSYQYTGEYTPGGVPISPKVS